MARSQSPGDLKDFWQEIEDIRSSKKQDDDDDDQTKTPDEGEIEAAWLTVAGYGGLVNKFQAGKELNDDDIQAITESLPINHAEVVKRRVDTLNATLRKKQKYTTKIDVRNIFPEQRPVSTTVIHSQAVGDDTIDTVQTSPRSPYTNKYINTIVVELPKSPTSPRGEVVHPEWNRNRISKGRGSFMKNKGGYSMSGTRDEVQDNIEMGVEMLRINQKRNNRHSTGSEVSPLSPISDSDITFELHIEENDNDDVLIEKSPTQNNLPNFSLVPDKLGQTCIDDISSIDVTDIRNLAFLELTSLYDTHNISYSRRRPKKKTKDTGIFEVPLTTLMENDTKRQPQCMIPLVFLEIISYMTRCCLDSEGILRIPGSVTRVKQLQQELEERFYQGTFIWADDLTPNDIATLMKQFLRDLPVPLLTDEYIEAFAQVESLPEKKSQLHALNLLILLLPDVHRNTLRVLLELLELIIEHSNTNKMSLNNVAMIMAPNLFMAPKVTSKSKVSWELEMKLAATTSNIMRMMIHYRHILWTVPTYLLSLVRRQNEVEQIKKIRDKSKVKGLLSKKDKTDVYKKPALIHETDFQAGVIRIQAPNLTKSSMAIQLDNHMTAGDIVAKFKVGGDTDSPDNSSVLMSNSNHGQIFVDHRNFQSAGDDTFLFEVGGNIGERCLPHNTNMAALYNLNPNAEWIIKRRERFKVT
ncbi:Rho GTPase activating protein 18 [Mactra antiquata]